MKIIGKIFEASLNRQGMAFYRNPASKFSEAQLSGWATFNQMTFHRITLHRITLHRMPFSHPTNTFLSFFLA